ncbi:HPr family phosphocarrier protein [Neobacillus drentensis]|uniref:HPr family phosphocarrier protein n=1 Tax=Neobacillus drentensis TaxID=220684 RepID=UPI002FFEFD65
MIQKNVIVKLKTGLQSRPAALFVQEANKFLSNIFVLQGNKKLNAKSVMGIMSLGLKPGARITITAEGPDELEAVEQLDQMLVKNL